MKNILLIALFSVGTLITTSCSSLDRSDPKSVVAYFFQSKIDQNDRWKEVLPPEDDWSKKLNHALESYEQFEFLNFEVISIEDANTSNRVWVTVDIEIQYKGETDGGKDQVTLEKVEGKWTIVELPM